MPRRPKFPGATPPVRLDHALIQRVIDAFPDGKGWSAFHCCDLMEGESKEKSTRRLAWDGLQNAPDTSAGVYAFLFPTRVFPGSSLLHLHGPSVKGRPRRIAFQLKVRALPQPLEGTFVAYVGRSASLRDRLPLHFHATKKTSAAQVRKALEACLGVNARTARDFMLAHARVAYCRIPGDRNVANRDIIEVALWAKFCTPFNIKSER